MQSIIGETFDAYQANPQGLSWQRIELALAMLYGFGTSLFLSRLLSIRSEFEEAKAKFDPSTGQAISATGPGAFVVVPPTEIQRAKRETDYKIDYKQFPLSPLGAMMLRACDAKIVEYLHPAVSLQMFEVAVRYHDFFKICPEFITVLLPSFLDGQCVLSSSSSPSS